MEVVIKFTDYGDFIPCRSSNGGAYWERVSFKFLKNGKIKILKKYSNSSEFEYCSRYGSYSSCSDCSEQEECEKMGGWAPTDVFDFLECLEEALQDQYTEIVIKQGEEEKVLLRPLKYEQCPPGCECPP